MELTGIFTCPGGVALLVKGCGTRLLFGNAGNSDSESFEGKGKCEHGGTVSVAFHSLPSTSSSK